MSNKLIFLVGIALGLIMLATLATIIYTAIDHNLKLIFFIFILTLFLIAQLYTYKCSTVDSKASHSKSTHQLSALQNFRKFSLLFSGVFAPVILSIAIYILWVKI